MLPKVLKSWNLFIDGRGFAGTATKVKLPKLEIEGDEYRGGGMLGPVQLDLGMAAMELGFTLAEFSAPVLRAWGIDDVSGIQARFLGAAVGQDGSGTDAIEISARGRWKSIDMGEAESKKLSTMDVVMPLSYYRYSLNGEVLAEVDFIAGTASVNGKSLFADALKALGLV